MNSISETAAFEALRTAQCNEHKGDMKSSAQLAARDAESLFNKGDFKYAYLRALDSLSYSVGLFHADHQRIKALGA